ncbi:MAG: hypothetical protein HKO13_09275 [Sphingomonas sp.]|nr:hypothetical protein [Sphingomonas sp.]RZV53045.1 MAG: hypothetical protein EX258_01090 [Sphingomonadaceae bacterium]
MKRLLLLLSISVLTACGGSPPDALSEEDLALADPSWPETLPAANDGYPDLGDPCRLLGEAEATRPFMDEGAELVGCRDPRDAAMIDGARVVGEVEGITIVSVALPPPPPEVIEDPDAAEPAARLIACTGRGIEGAARCTVTVDQLQDGTSQLNIQFDNGNRRTLYFEGTSLVGADSSEADGSAAFVLDGRRDFDRTIVSYGPERFVIPHSLLPSGPVMRGQPTPLPAPPVDPLAALPPSE